MLNIYLNTWGNYNEHGAEFGEWVRLPMDEDELQEKMNAIAEVMEKHGVNAEEWFINDYEWTGDFSPREIGEHENIFELNDFVKALDDLSFSEQDIYKAACEVWGAKYVDIDDIDGGYRLYEEIHTDHDLGWYWVEESGCYDLSDLGNLRNYIDYESFGRDIRFESDGGFSSLGWIERC